MSEWKEENKSKIVKKAKQTTVVLKVKANPLLTYKSDQTYSVTFKIS